MTYHVEHGVDLSMPPVDLDPARTALFLDFDGTLADIVDDPAAVTLDGATRAVLDRLHAATGGALAIVSGRGIGELDRFLAPLKLPLGAIHGLERRIATGDVERALVSEEDLEALGTRVRAFAADAPGLIVEFKSAAVAIHYRQAQYLRERVLRFADMVETELPGVRLVPGKMVVELKLGSRTKADAIEAFLAEHPFRGRRPVFAGDDVTDEDGFRAVDRWNGLSIKVGAGPSRAAHRLDDPPALRAWLAAVCRAMASAKEATGP